MKRKNSVHNCEHNGAHEKKEEKSEFSLDDIYPEGSLNAVKHFDCERVITRPNLHLKRVSVKVLLAIIAVTICGIVAKIILKRVISQSSLCACLISLVVLLAIITVKLKSILIWLVLVYQNFAPERIRRKCVFTPSCSEYMILSLKKYGVIKGVINGIKRLKRCHLPNHGEDYP